MSGTAISIQGVTANTNTIGVAKLHPAANCTSYTSDDGGATPNAVRKAIIDETVGSTFNATSVHRGTMSKEDKTKLDAFSAASTYATKTELNAKYTKPTGGIPKTDLASDVQTSLGKADSALQSHQSLKNYVDLGREQLITGVKHFGADATHNVVIGYLPTPQGFTPTAIRPYMLITRGATKYILYLPLPDGEEGATLATTADIPSITVKKGTDGI